MTPVLPKIMRKTSKGRYQSVGSTTDFQNREAKLANEAAKTEAKFASEQENLGGEEEDLGGEESTGECFVCLTTAMGAILIACGHGGLCAGSLNHA